MKRNALPVVLLLLILVGCTMVSARERTPVGEGTITPEGMPMPTVEPDAGEVQLALMVNELAVVSAEEDAPGHLEYTRRLGESMLARIEDLRRRAERQRLVRANAVLTPFGYRLADRFDAEWNRTFYDLYCCGKAEPTLSGLSHVWPISGNASGTESRLFAENAPNASPLYLMVRLGSLESWDADQAAFLPPVCMGDTLVSVTFSGFPTLRYKVEVDGRVVYLSTAVARGAYMPLRSLHAWDGHWALEVDDHLIVDGYDICERSGCDAAFGLNLVGGRPFYFFTQEGKVRISYRGETLPNVYDQVFHNQCCEGAIHNVESLEDVILFHALRNGIWYFVEAGRLSDTTGAK